MFPNGECKVSAILVFSLALYSINVSGFSYDKEIFTDPPTQTPDLIWDPRPFINTHDFNARYIDFEKGNDKNKGSKAEPWKHHPWDRNAKGRAAKSKGINTYYFKKGITYRGQLEAKDSGTIKQPIVLTVDPAWGAGEAVISGSQLVNKGWKICSEREAKILPLASGNVTWCRRISHGSYPAALWELSENKILRIPLARTPNWKVTVANDPRLGWAELKSAVALVSVNFRQKHNFSVGDAVWVEGSKKAGGSFGGNSLGYKVVETSAKSIRLELPSGAGKELRRGSIIISESTKGHVESRSNAHETAWRLQTELDLKLDSESQFKNATIWVERSGMPMPVAAPIDEINIKDRQIYTNLHLAAANGPKAKNRYYLEGAAAFLDEAGEFYYERINSTSGIVYLRLPGDRNPNESSIEMADSTILLKIHNQNHIRVSGLTFRFSNQLRSGTREARNAALYASAVQVRGSVSNIQIEHCRISNVATGIVAYPLEDGIPHRLTGISVKDSEFSEIEGQAISVGNGRERTWYRKLGSRLGRVNISRNKLNRIGLHPLGHWGLGSHGHGIEVNGGEITEIDNNHINHVGGSGVFLFTGSSYEGAAVTRPFLRTLVHHNKVTNSLLRLQDYGGISVWMGGPAYIFNNILGNPVGYRYAARFGASKSPEFRRGSYGVGIYLDGQYKGYVFNNIIWGYSNDLKYRYYNAAAFNEAMGYMNTVFNNTFYRFIVGLHKGMIQHNRCYYVGNLFIDMGKQNIMQEPANNVIDYATLAFKNNVFSGDTDNFGQLGRGSNYVFKDIKAWQENLRSKKALAADTGAIAKREVVLDKTKLNFTPLPETAVIDGGGKVFVPWSLSRVVGEWSFLQSNSDAALISGENINMNSEWLSRAMFDDIPRNNLHCLGIDAGDYQYGVLETWTKGALRFNGTDSYCALISSELSKDYSWNDKYSGKSGLVRGEERDTVDMDNENILIEIVLRIEGQGVVQPIVSKMGENGYILDVNELGRVRFTLRSGGSIARRTSSVSLADGKWHHLIAEFDRRSINGISIFVDGEPVNGKWDGEENFSGSLSNAVDFLVGRYQDSYFNGIIDYLRIGKSTLKQAETTIEELHKWQFDGPFLYDFTGHAVSGGSRDAGAVEYIKQ